jgi:hypothetical protein
MDDKMNMNVMNDNNNFFVIPTSPNHSLEAAQSNGTMPNQLAPNGIAITARNMNRPVAPPDPRAVGASMPQNSYAHSLATISKVDRSDDCIDYLIARTEMARKIAVEESFRLHQSLLARREMQRIQMMDHHPASAPFQGHTSAPSLAIGPEPHFGSPHPYSAPPFAAMPSSYHGANQTFGSFGMPSQMQPNSFHPSLPIQAHSTQMVQAHPSQIGPAQQFATPASGSSNGLNTGDLPSDSAHPPRKARVDLKSLWGRRYGQLVEFKNAHGHCNVPQRYAANAELGRWVKDQRTFKVKGKLTQERIELLEEIGFQWKIKCHDDFWEKMCADLSAYKEANGHCNVSMSNTDNTQLARWVDRNRRARKNGKISEEKVQQLNELGFCWTSR